MGKRQPDSLEKVTPKMATNYVKSYSTSLVKGKCKLKALCVPMITSLPPVLLKLKRLITPSVSETVEQHYWLQWNLIQLLCEMFHSIH